MISLGLLAVSLVVLIALIGYSVMKWRWVLFYWILLMLFGIGALYSVSIYESFDLSLKLISQWRLSDTSNYYFFFDQIVKLFAGLVLCALVYIVPWKYIKKRKYLIFFATLILMLLLFTPLADDFNKWATLWISIAWNTIQPWEFFKVGFMFLLIDRLYRKKKTLDELQYYAGFLVMTWLVSLLFFVLPDFGSLLVLWPVALLVFRYMWGKLYYVGCTLILAFLWLLLASSQFSYVQERLEYFLDPASDSNSRGIGRQTRQALISVWWWWFIGKWYGKWLQKFGYIPEAQSDFIFAAFSEEIGFLGNSILLTLYFLLAWYAVTWLSKVHDEYDKWFLVAMIWLLFVQAFVNIGVNIKLLPLTGITLPFVSHGGSALIVNMVQVVLIHKIIWKV
jgi:cell division protein FtsW (lipid II flippase)